MHLSFIDASGERGRIRSDLTVEYCGTWEGRIENAVEEIREDAELAEADDRELYRELIVRLPEESPIVSIEYHEGPA